MSLKLKCHQKKITPTEMSQKLKCHEKTAKYQNGHLWELKEELKRTEKNLTELKLTK